MTTAAPVPVRSVLIHIGWPKTATTSLQAQLVRWPNVAGRPYDSPEGQHRRRELLRAVSPGGISGAELDALLERSWPDRTRPVILSNETFVGMRKWRRDPRADAVDVPSVVARTSWQARILVTVREAEALVRSTYRYAVVQGCPHPYRRYLADELALFDRGRSRLDLDRIVSAWAAAFGDGSVLVRSMSSLVEDPAHFWRELSDASGMPALAELGSAPMTHRNETRLGPLGRELAVNRALGRLGDGRVGTPASRVIRRTYRRRIGPHLAAGAASDLADGLDLERELVERIAAGMDAVVARHGIDGVAAD